MRVTNEDGGDVDFKLIGIWNSRIEAENAIESNEITYDDIFRCIYLAEFPMGTFLDLNIEDMELYCPEDGPGNLYGEYYAYD